jgi:hypothetical protein
LKIKGGSQKFQGIVVDKMSWVCYFGSGNSKNGAKMELAIPKIEEKWS